MNNDIKIASMALCLEPLRFDGGVVLSASNSVWESVQDIPEYLIGRFSDDVGGQAKYSGFLQPLDEGAISEAENLGIYACLRCVSSEFLEYVCVVPNTKLYDKISSNLVLAGWDVCNGNGWSSASTDGIFPFDPVGLEPVSEFEIGVNEFSLIECLEDCLKVCEMNNIHIPEHAPWYPVGVTITINAFRKFQLR